MTWFEYSGDKFVELSGDSHMPFEVCLQSPSDLVDITTLVGDAFGPDRKKRTVYQFRDGISQINSLCFVAHAEGKLVGSIQFWPAQLPNGIIVPLLGPLAVWPELRGKGVGRTLIKTGLEAAKLQGFPAVLIVGDPGYYAPFGFNVDAVENIKLPGAVAPLVFMGVEFKQNSLHGAAGNVTPQSIS